MSKRVAERTISGARWDGLRIAYQYVKAGRIEGSYDGDTTEDVAGVNATSTFHFNDTDCSVLFAIQDSPLDRRRSSVGG